MTKQNQVTTTQKPIRLQSAVFKPFLKYCKEAVAQYGVSFAVNLALAQYLRDAGIDVSPLDTPADRIRKGQKKRWKAIKEANSTADQKAADRRKKKALAEKARRARIKLAKIQESENTA